jgi:hypothetical protein
MDWPLRKPHIKQAGGNNRQDCGAKGKSQDGMSGIANEATD